MYGLPSDLDLKFFIGITLTQLCFGENEVILNFDGDVSITIESKLCVRGATGQAIIFDDSLSSASMLVELVSDSITEAIGRQDGTLCLSFAGGATIEIHDSSEHYESYHIRHGKRIYVV